MSQRAEHLDFNLLDSLIDSVEGAATAGGGLGNVSRWIETNTRDPADTNKKFSLKGHEYCRAILDDRHPMVVLKKCTQIGATEFSIRLALAVLAKFRSINAIYALPTVHAAQKIASTRFDTVIESSPRLKSMVHKDVDSTLLKRINSSFLHLAGSATTSAAISTPARALFIDELEWCDPKVVSVFMSRLGHQAESDRIIRFFSSPLFPSSGITAYYEAGTQNSYFVWHTHCSSWVLPNLLTDLILPGYDDSVTLLTPSDIDSPNHRVNDAFIRCPKCGHPITTENLAEPTYRYWVPAFPDREFASFDCNALVLPQIRTPARLLKDLKLYGDNPTWQRFGCGSAAESAGEMILRSVIENSFTVQPQGPLSGTVTGAVLGMDVGKTSHLAIGKKVGKVLEIVHLEKVIQDGSNNTKNVFVERYSQYRAVQGVIDSAPDLTIPKSIQEETPYNNVWAAFFIRGQGRSSLTPYVLDEGEGVIKVNRTKILDEFVSQVNKGYVKFPRGSKYEEEVKTHLQQLKRITDRDGTGEEKNRWISSSSEDHWFFACAYLYIAAKLCDDNTRVYVVPSSSLLLGKVKMKTTIAHAA